MGRVDVAVFMGSSSDWAHLRPAVDLLGQLGVTVRVHVSSAHRTPERTVTLVREAEAAGCRVFICAAGMAAHLAGAVAAHTLRPVLGVPLPGGILDGVDALLSTVQMPGGVPVATFGVGAAGARNAAVFAAEILGLDDPRLGEELQRIRGEGAAKVEAGELEVRASLGD